MTSQQPIFTPGDFTFWFDKNEHNYAFVISYKRRWSCALAIENDTLRADTIQAMMEELIWMESKNGH